ncbi:MAG TPA: CARDB domain-containing protein, partial [Methylomirabilota bacterium]|nr:CARDB domain-containing protein [Methylomirabilota bacterium]
RVGLLDTPPVAGGVTATVSGAVTIPPDQPLGVYFLSVVADALNTVAESVESNNGLTAASTLEIVPSLPDLVVTSVGIPGETQTGKSVATPTTVVNAGPAASPPYRVGLFLSKDDPTPGAGTMMAMKDMPALAPGASAAVPLSLALPEDLSQGQYFVSAVADVNRLVPDADRSNNALASELPFRVNRNIGGFKTASATLSIAPAVSSPSIGAPFPTAATTACIVNAISPLPVTLNLSGSLTVTGQTSNTGQGTTLLKGNIVRSDGVIVGTGTLTGTFNAVINDSDIATVTVNFTLAIVPAGAVPAPPPATGRFTTSGHVAPGEIQTTLTSGSIDGCGPLSGTVTFRGTQSFFFSLLFFADGGAFAGSTTPHPTYPLPIDAYSAGVVVLFDTTPAPLDQVRFTGPPGSGMSSVPADIRQNFAAGSFYETDTFGLPATSLRGTWFVSYEGATKSFTVAEPQATQRFVAMLPTVTLDSSLRITRIDWVFKDRLTGATVPAPMNADALQVELDEFGVHLYTSPNFTRTVTTTGPLPTPIPVSQVTNLYISYKDTLSGNFYVTSYTRD